MKNFGGGHLMNVIILFTNLYDFIYSGEHKKKYLDFFVNNECRWGLYLLSFYIYKKKNLFYNPQKKVSYTSLEEHKIE